MNAIPAPPATAIRRWPFASYSEYADYQASRARRTRGLTRGYGDLRRRLAALSGAHAPQAASLLCLGARSRVEVDDFRRLGYAAEGVDLAPDGPVRRGDMADLTSGDGHFARPFDAFLFSRSLEHCWDLERFRRCSLPFCRTAIVAAVSLPSDHVSRWRCLDLGLQGGDADAQMLESALPGFRTVHREKFADVAIFVLLRTDAEPQHGRSPPSAAPMKNVMVANHVADSKHARANWERLLGAQIDNSLEVGWSPDDILLTTNFPYHHRGVTARVTDLNRHCLRGSKMFAVCRLLQENWPDDTVLWAHDLDCWQNVWFDAPRFADVGACEYSRPTFNGGSVFWRPRARDIAAEIVGRLQADAADREEPTMNEVFRTASHRDRVTVLNPTYNVGCSGFRERLDRSLKPVRASHFHPTNRLAWETHVLNRHGYSDRSAGPRLEAVVRRWFPDLPVALRAAAAKSPRHARPRA